MKSYLNFIKLFLIFASFLFIFSSCLKDDNTLEKHYWSPEDYSLLTKTLDLPTEPQNYDFTFPQHYNGVTRSFHKGRATLGRVLFYDKNLSEDNSISCASCHDQKIAFSDDVAFSEGVQQRRTSRNSLALGSVFSFNEYYGQEILGRIPFFWDNSASSVQEQAAMTLGNENEMDMDMHQVLDRVQDLDYYGPLFKTAFGDDDIDETKILDAIAVFVNSIGSFDSKYDRALDDYISRNGRTNQYEKNFLPMLSESENRGKDLYIAQCGSCHGSTISLPGKVSANNGLDLNYEDKGENGASKFKIPTLRNITLTGPYMHDGRFASLSDVVDHYSNGIQNHSALDADLKTNSGQPKQMNFTDQEKEDLIAFMGTFKDDTMINDERYSDPFK